MQEKIRRYAIYFAPEPGSALFQFGSRWLGRDASNGASFAHQAVDGIPAGRVAEITASPRMYGFHATLKPPFRMAAGATERDLREVLDEFAAKRAAFDAPPLRLGKLGSFLALVLSAPSPQFEALAADAVRCFDRFRMPATAEEIERRKHPRMKPRQIALLRMWGYPYVLDQWRFHMSLTGSLPEEDLQKLSRFLALQTEPFASQPLRVDAVCLFEQAGEGMPFSITGRYPFGR